MQTSRRAVKEKGIETDSAAKEEAGAEAEMDIETEAAAAREEKAEAEEATTTQTPLHFHTEHLSARILPPFRRRHTQQHTPTARRSRMLRLIPRHIHRIPHAQHTHRTRTAHAHTAALMPKAPPAHTGTRMHPYQMCQACLPYLLGLLGQLDQKSRSRSTAGRGSRTDLQ